MLYVDLFQYLETVIFCKFYAINIDKASNCFHMSICAAILRHRIVRVALNYLHAIARLAVYVLPDRYMTMVLCIYSTDRCERVAYRHLRSSKPPPQRPHFPALWMTACSFSCLISDHSTNNIPNHVMANSCSIALGLHFALQERCARACLRPQSQQVIQRHNRTQKRHDAKSTINGAE